MKQGSASEQKQKENIPSQEVLKAFGVNGEPVLLPGGQGTSYRVGNTVLKPTKDPREASWIATMNAELESTYFRVPKPFQAKDGSWVYNDWTASEFLPGEQREGSYREAITLCVLFHERLQGIPKPEWFDQRTDVFSLADKMAWGELPLPDFELTYSALQTLQQLVRPIDLPSQLIHGDWGIGQILFHEILPPGIVDMTPYFRPSDYPIADMLLQAVIDRKADISIFHLGKGVTDFDQLLVRALIFRICTYVTIQTHPESTMDWSPVINKYLSLVDTISSFLHHISQ